MEKRRLGKTGMMVSVLGFGGAEIGFQGADEFTVQRLLNTALDAGLNVIDTAECYVNSEELIGQAVAHRRKDYYLFTKCGHANKFDIPAFSASAISKSIDQSLKRLRTDYLDLIQLHSCDLSVLKKGEVIEALNQARQAGKTRYIGYSGDGLAAKYAVECDAFDTLQTSISIADQEAITLTLPAAHQRKMGVIAKRPIANACWRNGAPGKLDYSRPYWDRLQKLGYAFLNDDLQKSISIALRFTLSVPEVHVAIVGTQNPQRWTENARVLEHGSLEPKLFNEIRSRWQEVSENDWTGQV